VLAQRVLAALITAEGTKQVLSQKALERDIGDAALEAILQQLVDERLLRQHASADETHYELAHEYLMKEITTWISEKERRHKSIKELLERELSYWRIFGTLIHPDRLQIIEQWLQEPGAGPLSPEGQELVEKSRERRSLDEQEQLQLIQSAKMTSIDQLVMGIGHELNTPIACISSDSQQLRKAVENMRGILEQLPELLLDARQGAADWPTPGSRMSKQTRDRFAAYIDHCLAALSQQIPRRLRETRLWDITSTIDAIADELEEGAVRTTQLFKALSSFVEPNQTRRQPTDIRTPLEHAQLLLGYELKYHATVKLQHGDSFSVNGSPNQLVQLFMNVLMNSIEAIKAMESRSGSIDVTISHDHISGIVLISDNGIGIPPANREQVFRPGFTTKGAPHRGLGLSIAQQIVRRHNGSLKILAVPQPGTTLEIRLPLSDLGKSYGYQ
jgi:signal transduction histidine kinase